MHTANTSLGEPVFHGLMMTDEEKGHAYIIVLYDKHTGGTFW